MAAIEGFRGFIFLEVLGNGNFARQLNSKVFRTHPECIRARTSLFNSLSFFVVQTYIGQYAFYATKTIAPI